MQPENEIVVEKEEEQAHHEATNLRSVVSLCSFSTLIRCNALGIVEEEVAVV